MQSMNDIRTAFLQYFSSREHQVVPSASVVPENDPTLLFTNAGMVQFKNVFTGLETRDYSRAVSSQKCIRAGGKHNDLDNVGFTARHHTFFEMLGNFSFGDYFKEEAIIFAWDFLTRELGINSSKLLATVYAEDEVAFDLWKKITGLPDSKIIKIGTSDNFWSMGNTGPCGPCSEIFYDHGEQISGGPPGSIDEDGDRFVEIWNLVFMQFDQPVGGDRIELPRPSIDTGMGLERVTAVLQGVHDNYDTDLFRALIAASEAATGTLAQGNEQANHRVIADHLRSCSFMLADGVSPSNEGRGYVLRRIMRRAMRHLNLLGVGEPLMHTLVPELVTQMGDAYPELINAQSMIENSFHQEEERFLRTLDRGMALLEAETSDLKPGAMLSGDVAFRLYDTYGFPLDLTKDALRTRNIEVDTQGFSTCMQRQKEKARAAWKGSGDTANNAAWTGLKASLAKTRFTGYDNIQDTGKLIGLVVGGKSAKRAEPGMSVEMAFDQTPFYGESGGQAGDAGTVVFGNDSVVDVYETSKLDGIHILRGEVVSGKFAVGDLAEGRVDVASRDRIRQNHSGTHLLHAALRRRLGEGVLQKGSYVGPDRLRFDFSHGSPVSKSELAAIECEVNSVIWENLTVSTQIMTPDAARERGAMALFGEKYGDEVRVLAMGNTPEDPEAIYSIELCGGTHVARTGDIGLLRIVSESAVASGVRRIEALTGEAARLSFSNDVDLLHEASAALKVSPVQLIPRLTNLMAERRKLETELSDTKRKLALGQSGSGSATELENIGGVSFRGQVVEGIGGKDLRALVDQAKVKINSAVIVFIGVNDDKASLCVGVTADLTDRLSAVELVRVAAAMVGGKGGGGRPDMAQAGGPDGGQAQAALQAVRDHLQNMG
ncbi:MAG: alanine--tRNA ligase [Robiginitomaculum sp.]|nr:MAG: alanine--tRNA ligase [Robiginitomaculum sp.]